MREERSTSQILFGFLPEQTIDLRGKVWKVKEWENPSRRAIDMAMVKRELCRVAAPWSLQNNDGGYTADIHKGREVIVYSLNKNDGVRVTAFPDVWMCKSCHRISNSAFARCPCGSQSRGQLPFVGYHDKCGSLRSPFIPTCDEHKEVRVILPGTASAAEIRFICPTCKKLLRKGLGTPRCDCGKGNLSFTVHRAASVYTPRTIVIVNPPSPEQSKRLLELGGPSKALSWVLDGLKADALEGATASPDTLRQMLKGTADDSLIEEFVQKAIAKGSIREERSLELSPECRQEAEEQAVTVATALMYSRIRISDLLRRTPPDSPRSTIYREQYPQALRQAGLQDVELLDKFPVLTGSFGYTRGSATPGASRLVPFRDRRRNYAVFAEIAETEALFVRLDPFYVAQWLRSAGFDIPEETEEAKARAAIIRAARIPGLADNVDKPTAGSALLSLVHSYSHRFIRLAALHAGIERSSLSELLVPLHAGFFIYAAARGEFVLGGLQAVFETDLARLLHEIVAADHRCALDPGCQRSGGACMACLHLGEPSCRYFNRYLNRATLSGRQGFLRMLALTRP